MLSWSSTGTNSKKDDNVPLWVLLVHFYKYIQTKLNCFGSLLCSLLLNICRIASKVNTVFQCLSNCRWMFFPSNSQISVSRNYSFANKLIWADNRKSLILIRSCHIIEKRQGFFCSMKSLLCLLAKMHGFLFSGLT